MSKFLIKWFLICEILLYFNSECFHFFITIRSVSLFDISFVILARLKVTVVLLCMDGFPSHENSCKSGTLNFYTMSAINKVITLA